MMGCMFCQICKVIGKLTTGDDEAATGPVVENGSDSASTVATYTEEAHRLSSKGKRAKKMETISEAIRRVTCFMQARIFN
jgi:hypothetical protein